MASVALKGASKEMAQLMRSIEHMDGVEIRQSGANHVHIFLRGKLVCSTSSTPSDPRTVANTRAQLRRAGITPPVNGRRKQRKQPKPPKPLLSLEELRNRVEPLHIPDFARFLVNDMPAVDPGLKTYRSASSAEVAMRTFVKGGGLREWSHLLLDSAIRAWDRVEARKPQPEPEIVTELKLRPELTATDAKTGETVTITFKLDDLVALAERFGVRLNFETRQEEER